MELWTALFLGLLGSLHCAAMCGPLALALPVAGNGRAAFVIGRLVYNAGRVATYGMLGAVFGLVGQTAALAGLQRWLSLAAGVAILGGLFASSKLGGTVVAARAIVSLKTALGARLRQRSFRALGMLGLLNGLLPCGLVYVACAGAVATGGFASGFAYMIAFGLGTLPLMLGLSLAGRLLPGAFRFRFQKLIPISVVLVATLLILRGLALGIPYLSPDLAAPNACCQ